MLNTFPMLLVYEMAGPMILRVALGLVIILAGLYMLSKKRAEFINFFKKNKFPIPMTVVWFLGIIEFLVGTFLIIGFLTQINAIIAIIISLFLICFSKDYSLSMPKENTFYILMIAIALSLLFSGAGFYSFDLPL